jgi:hypothetical protein
MARCNRAKDRQFVTLLHSFESRCFRDIGMQTIFLICMSITSAGDGSFCVSRQPVPVYHVQLCGGSDPTGPYLITQVAFRCGAEANANRGGVALIRTDRPTCVIKADWTVVDCPRATWADEIVVRALIVFSTACRVPTDLPLWESVCIQACAMAFRVAPDCHCNGTR